MHRDQQLFDFLLRLADSDLILAQRLGAWIGHGPVLEEDIASANVGLDLIGQARMWYAYAGEVEARFAVHGRNEDELAFLRDSAEYRDLLLVEQPNGDYAHTIARQFYFDVWHDLYLDKLVASRDARIAEIAAKSAKEVRYHVERSTGWVIRLGDGTDESHRRMQAAIDDLWMYTGEMFEADEMGQALAADGIAADVAGLAAVWRERVSAVLAEATLTVPAATGMQTGGKRGAHSEHLSHLLAEMQVLQRNYPGARW